MVEHTITDEQIIELLERIPNGLSLKQACDDAKLKYATVVTRIHRSETLKSIHAQAKVDYQHYMVESMHDIARDEPDTQRARLMCDNIKWTAQRIARADYGDKTAVEHSGEVSLRDLVLGSYKKIDDKKD